MSLAEPHPQNDFINAARKERKRVEVYLVNGIRLVGYIESFDQYLVMLRTSAGLQGIYKRAISTIQHDTGSRSGGKARQNRAEHNDREHTQQQRRGPYNHGTREFRDSRDSRQAAQYPGEPAEPGASAESHAPLDPSSREAYSSSATPSFFTTSPERASSGNPVIITRRRRVWSHGNVKDNGSDEH
jgi:host factor-I protein